MAAPGAAIGSLVGALWCGVAGGAAATNVAQSMTKSDEAYMRLVCYDAAKFYLQVFFFV